MPIPLQQLHARLAAAPLAPVYLIAGSEDLLRLEAADAVRARARELGFGEREVFEAGGGFDWNALHAAFGAMSLFASRRLLELRLPTGRPGTEGAALIEAYCRQPPPDLCLLITAGDWSGKHEAAWSRAVDKAGLMVPVPPLKAAELPAWIATRLRARGSSADPDAIALLAERIEGNLLAAAQEIDHLALLANGRPIDLAAMRQLVADSARYTVFGLVDAAFAGDTARTVRMLRGLRAEGEQVPGLMAWIGSQLQAVARVAAARAGGAGPAQVARESNVPEWRMNAYRRVLGKADAATFERLLSACAAVERSGKGRGDGDPWQQLERLLVALAQPAAAARLLAAD
jgi:DNA polymerase III subunit delta